jgi:hypothetical protein
MKLPLLFLLPFLLASTLLPSQTEVRLHIAPRLGDQPFALNTAIPTTDGVAYIITRLQYYVSEISIVHDGGQVTEVPDLWLLVDPAIDSVYGLGSLDVQNVEGLTFHLGVDSAHNHTDPASYPTGHPLAPKNPSMHWGWAAGYRFLAFEGQSGTGGLFIDLVEFHSIGDELYRAVHLPATAQSDGNSLTIRIRADYARLLNDLDVSGGVVAHGALGPIIKVTNNLQNEVFSSALSPVHAPAFSGSFELMPNPAPGGLLRAACHLPAGADYALTVSDARGQMLLRRPVAAGTTGFVLEERLRPGFYLVNLWQDGKPVHAEKLLVTD